MNMTAGIFELQMLSDSAQFNVKVGKDIHVEEYHECLIIDSVLNSNHSSGNSRWELTLDGVSIPSVICINIFDLHNDTFNNVIGMLPSSL